MLKMTKQSLSSKRPFARWQYISQGQHPWMHVLHIQLALEAGASWVQLRLKKQPTEVVVAVGKIVAFLCEQYGAIFILNDYLELVSEVKADGVHLGLSDSSVLQARKLLGNQAIIGGTANTAEDLRSRILEGVDYIGLGPYRFTSTKEKLSPILGLEGYSKLMQSVVVKENKTVPIYAIGGIAPLDIQPLLRVGLYGVAVSGFLSPQLAQFSFEGKEAFSVKRWQRYYENWLQVEGVAAAAGAIQEVREKVAQLTATIQNYSI